MKNLHKTVDGRMFIQKFKRESKGGLKYFKVYETGTELVTENCKIM